MDAGLTWHPRAVLTVNGVDSVGGEKKSPWTYFSRAARSDTAEIKVVGAGVEEISSA